ncbi:MAG: adenosylcobinamide amidohydrolase [Halochromatium sp.]
MLLRETNRYRLHRQGRYLWAAFKRPHRVLSTCKVNGGLREDLTHVANHQSCEGVAHDRRDRRAEPDPHEKRDGHTPAPLPALDAFHLQACREAGLPPTTTALMSTAANMQCAVLAQAEHEELCVSVVATAGVLGNATRAGDPAGWHEQREGSRPLRRPSAADAHAKAATDANAAAGTGAETAAASGADSQGLTMEDLTTMEDFSTAGPARAQPWPSPDETGAGTIVLLVFINQPCTPACLTRAATVVTEGKSTALLDLRMPSLQSAGLATGTGTDQLVLAAPLVRSLAPSGDAEQGWPRQSAPRWEPDTARQREPRREPRQAQEWERHWAGGHNSLGELLGRATHAAVTRCLLLQNGVCAELRRSICGALARHGCDETALRVQARAELAAPEAELFARNLTALIHDPQSAATAYALAEIIDLARAGVLHAEIAREALINQAALLAAAVAVAPEQFASFREALLPHRDLPPGALAARAVALGFARKWT